MRTKEEIREVVAGMVQSTSPEREILAFFQEHEGKPFNKTLRAKLKGIIKTTLEDMGEHVRYISIPEPPKPTESITWSLGETKETKYGRFSIPWEWNLTTTWTINTSRMDEQRRIEATNKRNEQLLALAKDTAELDNIAEAVREFHLAKNKIASLLGKYDLATQGIEDFLNLKECFYGLSERLKREAIAKEGK